MNWTCSILVVYSFLPQEGTDPLLSGQPELEGLFKMPAWPSDEVTSLCHRQIPSICLAEELPDKLGIKRFYRKPQEIWPWWCFFFRVWLKSCSLSDNILILEMQKGLINRTWSDHTPALGGTNKGWSLLRKLLPVDVCSQCCDLAESLAEGEQGRLINQEPLYKDKTELNMSPANTSDSLGCILGSPNQQMLQAWNGASEIHCTKQ